MEILVVVGLGLVIGTVAIVRHSRNFKGSGEHFESEEVHEVRLSRGYPGAEGGHG